MESHSFYMNICFKQAKKALGKTSPNPYVGSVLVSPTGEIISKGYHKMSGTDHAERDAIKNANQSLEGVTLYCNLEPCCHTNKKTAPCAQFIIENKITRVIIANLDPNPLVAGKGVKLMQDAGIEVITGVEKEKGARLNEVFFYHIQRKRPFIHLKWAQTLDGKIATLSNHSKWITQSFARQRVHKERSLYDAILVGAKTINIDNPKLTTRLDGQEEFCPTRIILSPIADLNFESHVFTDHYKNKTIVVTKSESQLPKDIKRINCGTNQDGFLYEELLDKLYKAGLTSIYVEGGSKVHNSFISQNYFQRVSIYIAPKLLGKGRDCVQLNEYKNMNDSIQFETGVWSQIGKDMVFESGENECLLD